jgi:thiol:disulfide interchange protein
MTRHLSRSILKGLGSLAVAWLTLAGIPAAPAGAQMPKPEKASLKLEADRTAYEAGTTARIAALVEIEHGWHVNSHKPTFDYLIPTVLDVHPPAGWPEEKILYPAAALKTFAFADQPLSVYDGQIVIEVDVQVPAGTPAGEIPVRATLDYQACNDSQCLPPVTVEAKLTIRVGADGGVVESAAAVLAGPGGPAAPAGGTPASAASPAAGPSLLWVLLVGLLGGLILNAMPCVLPVLSIKVFGLVRSASHGRAEVARGALATSAGILVSFWALALAAVAARAAGAAVGWGVQFQHPGFVAFLTVVVVLFCLNLWGLFEIQLPSGMTRLADGTQREGAAGHFFSGLFATLMATPCSAPFLGTAISFALAQPSAVVLAIFTAVGLGMSLPYLALAIAPGAARFLPRPGAWMETVRGVMGFLLAASAVWLFYVLAAQVSPEQVAGLQLGILALALFTWFRHRGPAGVGIRRLAGIGMLVSVVLVMAVATWKGTGTPLQASQAGGTGTGTVQTAQANKLIHWETFDRTRAEALAAEGKLVFVDVTADWCFTCKFNERLVLETPEVATAFAHHGVVPMKADWTNRDDGIAQFLASHGRYGIPFYLLYRPGAEPHVFSELLTKDGLLETVRDASRQQVAQR